MGLPTLRPTPCFERSTPVTLSARPPVGDESEASTTCGRLGLRRRSAGAGTGGVFEGCNDCKDISLALIDTRADAVKIAFSSASHTGEPDIAYNSCGGLAGDGNAATISICRLHFRGRKTCTDTTLSA